MGLRLDAFNGGAYEPCDLALGPGAKPRGEPSTEAGQSSTARSLLHAAHAVTRLSALLTLGSLLT